MFSENSCHRADSGSDGDRDGGGGIGVSGSLRR